MKKTALLITIIFILAGLTVLTSCKKKKSPTEILINNLTGYYLVSGYVYPPAGYPGTDTLANDTAYVSINLVSDTVITFTLPHDVIANYGYDSALVYNPQYTNNYYMFMDTINGAKKYLLFPRYNNDSIYVNFSPVYGSVTSSAILAGKKVQ